MLRIAPHHGFVRFTVEELDPSRGSEQSFVGPLTSLYCLQRGFSMVETFYKKEVEPGEQRAEYYSLAMTDLSAEFVVLEFHGWWDDKDQKPKLNRRILYTGDEPLSLSAAEGLYADQKRYLIERGFVHGYLRDYEGLRGPVGGHIHTDHSKKQQ
jgi:hypothetical protein